MESPRRLYLHGDTSPDAPQIRQTKCIFAEFNSSRILSKTSLKPRAFVYSHAWPYSQDGIPGSRQEIQGLDRWLKTWLRSYTGSSFPRSYRRQGSCVSTSDAPPVGLI